MRTSVAGPGCAVRGITAAAGLHAGARHRADARTVHSRSAAMPGVPAQPLGARGSGFASPDLTDVGRSSLVVVHIAPIRAVGAQPRGTARQPVCGRQGEHPIGTVTCRVTRPVPSRKPNDQRRRSPERATRVSSLRVPQRRPERARSLLHSLLLEMLQPRTLNAARSRRFPVPSVTAAAVRWRRGASASRPPAIRAPGATGLQAAPAVRMAFRRR